MKKKKLINATGNLNAIPILFFSALVVWIVLLNLGFQPIESQISTLPSTISSASIPSTEQDEIEPAKAQILQPSLPCSGKIGLVVRTYGADSNVFRSLVPQLKAFVNQEDFEVHFILDEEGETDHIMGAALEELGYIVHYEAMPPESVLTPRPFAFLGGKYTGHGYMRGQYAIYFLDQWLNCEIVGIVDSDAHFSSFLTREVAVRNNQVIIQGHESNYPGDLRAVGTNNTFSMMHRNNFPQFLYRDAWEVARAHLERMWGGNNSFEEAYLQWVGPQPTNPINLISHMAFFNDPTNKYRLVMSENPLEFAVPAVAWNFDSGYRHHACCRVYGVGCTDAMMHDTNHLCNPHVPSPKAVDWHHLEDAVRIHYDNVRSRLETLDPDEVAVMRSYCENMTPEGWAPIRQNSSK